MTTAPSSPIVVGLSAVIVATDERAPYALVTRDHAGDQGLPHGNFDPVGHRTFELGLRDWVKAQTGFAPGYVEQLYTFGDRGRELPQADLGDAPGDTRFISVCYLGLAPERTDISAFAAVWRDWYSFFPWEDHRAGEPPVIQRVIAPALTRWAEAGGKQAASRLERARTAFGLDGNEWFEERALERYELLYEAGLTLEAARDRKASEAKEAVSLGEPMISDHRRILATAIGRLRGKIKYRPVIFDLTPEKFTLSGLQKIVESVLGQNLHKQNFRRALDRSGLVAGTGQSTAETGGRPAELFRFVKDAPVQGVATPRA